MDAPDVRRMMDPWTVRRVGRSGMIREMALKKLVLNVETQSKVWVAARRATGWRVPWLMIRVSILEKVCSAWETTLGPVFWLLECKIS